MGVLKIDGTVTAGPESSGGSAFPSSSDQMQLQSTPNPKPMQACTGTIARNFNSPNAFTTLTGVGASDTVTRGDTLAFRCNAPMKLQMTFADPDGGADIVSVIPVYGMNVMEFPSNGYLKLLQLKGSGPIEYLVSGLQ